MKTTYYLTNPASIDGQEFPAGAPLATLETPDGVDPSRAVNAIARGLATANPPEAPAAPADAAAGDKPARRAK